MRHGMVEAQLWLTSRTSHLTSNLRFTTRQDTGNDGGNVTALHMQVRAATSRGWCSPRWHQILDCRQNHSSLQPRPSLMLCLQRHLCSARSRRWRLRACGSNCRDPSRTRCSVVDVECHTRRAHSDHVHDVCERQVIWICCCRIQLLLRSQRPPTMQVWLGETV